MWFREEGVVCVVCLSSIYDYLSVCPSLCWSELTGWSGWCLNPPWHDAFGLLSSEVTLLLSSLSLSSTYLHCHHDCAGSLDISPPVLNYNLVESLIFPHFAFFFFFFWNMVKKSPVKPTVGLLSNSCVRLRYRLCQLHQAYGNQLMVRLHVQAF